MASRTNVAPAEDEAVRLQDRAAARLEPAVAAHEDARGAQLDGPALVPAAAQPRVAVEDEHAVARVHGARVRARDEAAAGRVHGPVRREQPPGRVVAERGARDAHLLPRHLDAVEDPERPRALRELRARRADRDRAPVPRLARLEQDVLEAEQAVALVVEADRLGGRDAVAPLGLARLVVLEIAEAHAVAGAVRLREERLGHRVSRAFRAGPRLAVREDDEQGERRPEREDRRAREARETAHAASGERSTTVRPGRPVKESTARFAATSQRPAREGRRDLGEIPAHGVEAAAGGRERDAQSGFADGPAAPVPREAAQEKERLGVLLAVRLEALERPRERLVRLGRLDLGVDFQLGGPLRVVARRRERGAEVLAERLPRRARESSGRARRRVRRTPSCTARRRARRARRAASGRRTARCRPRCRRRSRGGARGGRSAAPRGTPRSRGRRGASPRTPGPPRRRRRRGPGRSSSRDARAPSRRASPARRAARRSRSRSRRPASRRAPRRRSSAARRPAPHGRSVPWRSGGARSGTRLRASRGRAPPGPPTA